MKVIKIILVLVEIIKICRCATDILLRQGRKDKKTKKINKIYTTREQKLTPEDLRRWSSGATKSLI